MTQRYFPEYGYGTPPRRGITSVGKGGYTTWFGDQTTNPNAVANSWSYKSYINIGTNTKHDADYPFIRFQTRAIENRPMGIYGSGLDHSTNGWYSALIIDYGSQVNLVSDMRMTTYGTEWESHPTNPGLSVLTQGLLDFGTDPAGQGMMALTKWESDDARFPGGQISNISDRHFWYDARGYGDSWDLLVAIWGDPYDVFQIGESGHNVNLNVNGVLSKSSGSFDIEHPTAQGKRLRHSFIEGPQADLIYRGTAKLGAAPMVIDMDTEFDMTPGTWEALNCTPWSMVSASGKIVEWEFAGSTLTITGDEGTNCMWMVIGERHDPHMKGPDCSMADGHGHLIVEYDEPEPLPTHEPENAPSHQS